MFVDRFLDVRGLRLHAVEAGTGPLVALLHRFPECWYSYRRQLAPLAAAGFRAVALDLRGYGRSDKPGDPHAYDQVAIAGDVVGAIEALGAQAAVVVGHDFGAVTAWHAALLHRE